MGCANKNGVRSYQPCADQFKESTPLAWCVSESSIPRKNDAGVLPAHIVERYYDLDSLTQANEYMEDCLQVKGEWHGVDKSSDAYFEATRARGRRNVAKAQMLVEQLQQQ